ncbi:hypothetical protein [Ralstonia mannitolilytica]|uniref:hypothetical protein n=1 Tax=Ralstonia mannitolilytica TaxID=105219 RepID=UPI0014258C2C|nr:hypothetical protein [Ralstonia mannitolilytica]
MLIAVYGDPLGCWLWGIFLFVVHPLFHPLPGRLTFFVLPKKSKQKKGAPDAATPSLNLCRKEGEEANSLRSNSLLSFSSLQHKFKAPHRAGKSKAKPSITRAADTTDTTRSKASNNSKSKGHPRQHTDGVAFDVPALDGALDFCCGEDKEGSLV